MSQKTPLYDRHVDAGGKMVPFAGWELPVHYGSQIDEHHAVRQAAGMFDVSHMAVVDIAGAQAEPFLQRLLANDVGRLGDGRALYSCMLNEQGGVIDDLIVYRLGGEAYRMVVNAATRDKDIDWIGRQARPFGVEVNERTDLGMIAVQGPEARAHALAVMPEALAESAGALGRFAGVARDGWFVGRTGYTGEDGFEIMLPAADARPLWDGLVERGVVPCGLGARDTLRLEAGLALYGNEMDETVSPLEAGLGWTIAWQPEARSFLGRPALERQQAQGVERRLVGLPLEGRGILRPDQSVRLPDGRTGVVTSGTYSPTLKKSIALARLPQGPGDHCEVEIRNRWVPARIVDYPFVRGGKPRV